MSLQDSPSLDDFKNGLGTDIPKNPSPLTRRTIIYFLLMVLLGLFVWNQLASKDLGMQQGTAVVIGNVVDENGHPLPAQVMIFGTNLQTTANEKGDFRIDGVLPGEVLLVVGYDDTAFQQPLLLKPGEVHDVGKIQYVTTQVPGI